MNIPQSLYEALRSKYESNINQAKATLLIYFSNPVGIGEHPQHLDEMDNLIGIISDNEDKLKALTDHFNYLTQNTQFYSSISNSNSSIFSTKLVATSCVVSATLQTIGQITVVAKYCGAENIDIM